MKYLIDTHTLLWIVTKNPKLSDKAKAIYLNPENEILISLASIWEMAIKISIKKLSIDEPLKDFIRNHVKGNDIKILNVELSHILALENLPFFHRDPFDRLIICQSINEDVPIISADRLFDSYHVNRIW